ncbi:MAG TPA: CAP domain-containing protein [Solirubrobacteraceae bacterium]|nr:CAP domain-containing protein [Solirubrobacteraceae bacterium]
MPDTRHASSAARRYLLQATVCAALLTLCVCFCLLASSAPATTLRPLSATAASSYASAPPKHAGCARRASFHSSGGPKRKRSKARGKHGASCGAPKHRRRHAARRTPPAARGACANAQLQPSAANLELVRVATLCLVNRERTSRGEVALKPNARLELSAQGHSTDMASGDYFAHDSRNGSTPLARMRSSGYIFSSHLGYAVGENIAWATLWLATPKAIVAGWMASPGHRANILDATFRDTGIGVSPHPLSSLAHGEAGAIYTQDFGRIIAP